MSEKLKAVVIGGGFAGMLHRDALLADSRVGSVAVVETNRQRRQELGVLGISTFANLDSLRQELGPPDIAALALPAAYNLAVVEQISEFYPKPTGVLIDKPLALTLEDAQKIEGICRKEFIVAMFGLTADFHPEFVAAKQLINKGAIGRIISFKEEISLGGPNLPPHYLTKSYGGVVHLNGVHSLRHLQNLTGIEDWDVAAAAGGRDYWRSECLDWAAATLVAVGADSNCQAQLNWHLPRSHTPKREDYQTVITGTKGRIAITGFEGLDLTTGSETRSESFHPKDRDLRGRHLPGFKKQWETFLNVVTTGGDSPLPLVVGVELQRMLCQIEEVALRE